MSDPIPDAETTKLLPCPFCGGSASIDGTGYSGPADCYEVSVRCQNCDARGMPTTVDQSENEDEADAVANVVSAWNRRADLAAAEIARLRTVLREPTEAMVSAGAKAGDVGSYTSHLVFDAMIDAALAPSSRT
jgi:Lar family restriction alleviation protein